MGELVRQDKLPEKWADLKEGATLAYQSGLLPKTISTPAQAITIAAMGKELGLPLMASLCGLYVVNGMAALRGSLMLRLIYERVPGAKINIVTPPEKAHEGCTVEMQRPNGTVQIFSFTREDANKAGFMSKPVWQSHTGTMLRWAAIRTGARIVFADAIAGVYMEDELPSSPRVPAEVKTEEPELPPKTLAPPPTEIAGEKFSFEEENNNPKPVDARQKPTTPQLKRLHAIKSSCGWTDSYLKEVMMKQFRKSSTKDLSWIEYERLVKAIQADPKQTGHPEEIDVGAHMAEESRKRRMEKEK